MPLLLALALTLGADDLNKRLDEGEIIVTTEAVAGSKVPRANIQAVIEAAPEKVWAIIDDCGNYSKTMPRIVASKQMMRDADHVECEVTADLPFPLSDLTGRTRATMTVEPGVKWTRSWTLVSGDYTQNTGSWQITPFKGDPKRTMIVYWLQVEPKISLPQFVITGGQKSALPGVIQRLREQTQGK